MYARPATGLHECIMYTYTIICVAWPATGLHECMVGRPLAYTNVCKAGYRLARMYNVHIYYIIHTCVVTVVSLAAARGATGDVIHTYTILCVA